MKNVLGLINLSENEAFMDKLTKYRPLAAVPFAGRYRLIDFVLSNMVNSDMHKVGIMTRSKYRSLLDHLHAGKEWDLDRKRDGLFILPPAQSQNEIADVIDKGDLGNFYANRDYIRRSSQKYVLISGSNMICNLDYHAAFQFHLDKKAHITVLYKPYNELEDNLQVTTLDVDGMGRVKGMDINPERIKHRNVSMEMYLMEKELLLDLIDSCASRGKSNLTRDGIVNNLERLNVYGYPFDGHLARINSVESYYRHSMELLDPAIWHELFREAGTIYTKVKDEAPAKYKLGSEVHNSLVASGCIIEGRVENCILFRGVKVQKGAHIKNSIIMQKGEIEGDAYLENVICDKDVKITSKKILKGELKYPFIIGKGIVI